MVRARPTYSSAERGVGVGPPLGLRLGLGSSASAASASRGALPPRPRLASVRVDLGEDLLELDGLLGGLGFLLLRALRRLELRELLVGRQLAALGDDFASRPRRVTFSNSSIGTS